MAYIFFLLPGLILAQLALALPNLRPRTSYADPRVTLRKDLQEKWYSDWKETSSGVQKPPNPSQFYSCAGPHMGDYPSKKEWLSFKDLWDINEPVITKVNNGDMYNTDIKNAIQDISFNSKVDARLILSLVMQESAGNVFVHCTGPTLLDCGLLQLRGSPSFTPSHASSSIHAMISAGIYGVAPIYSSIPYGNPGYLTLFNGFQTDLEWLGTAQFWRGNPYAAAHLYNAGEINGTNLARVDGGIERSRYYVNDVVSRLLGWDGGVEGCVQGKECAGLGFGSRVCL